MSLHVILVLNILFDSSLNILDNQNLFHILFFFLSPLSYILNIKKNKKTHAELPNPSSYDTAQSVRENFAPLSRENGEVPNTNTANEFDGSNLVNTIISLLCGLCNKDNSVQEVFGLDDQNNTTQRLVDPNRNDDFNNPGEQLSVL